MRTLGYALAVAGAAVLVGYAGYRFVVDFMLDNRVEVVVRLGVTGVVLGVLLLLASLTVERLRKRDRESFRDVRQ